MVLSLTGRNTFCPMQNRRRPSLFKTTRRLLFRAEVHCISTKVQSHKAVSLTRQVYQNSAHTTIIELVARYYSRPHNKCHSALQDYLFHLVSSCFFFFIVSQRDSATRSYIVCFGHSLQSNPSLTAHKKA
jgi:hypothetical protein